jgi:hypothetical protein
MNQQGLCLIDAQAVDNPEICIAQAITYFSSEIRMGRKN